MQSGGNHASYESCDEANDQGALVGRQGAHERRAYLLFASPPAARYAVVYVSRRLSRCSCRPRTYCLCRLGRNTLSCARIAFPPVARCSLRGRLVASPPCDESLFSAVFDARISSIRLSSTWTVTSQIYFLARTGFSCLCASLAYSFSLCQRPLLRGYASCMRHDAIYRDI